MEELINRVAKAPLIAKIGGALLLVSLITLLNYLLLISPVESTIEMQRGQQRTLEAQLAEKQEIAQNLTDYRRELETLEQKLSEALTELPNNASLDELLAQFNDVGKKAGLQIARVQPGGETRADFYARIPVKMQVSGNYHEVAMFFQEVGNLRRIVNVSDIALKSNVAGSDKVLLTADFLATTFRFLDQTPNAGDKKGSAMKKLLPLVAGLAGLGLVACGDDKPAPSPAPIARKATGPAKEEANKAPPYVYSYNPTGKRDPFRSPMGDFAARPTANSSCSEPLCQYDLDQLTLVAVVTGDANPVAMVEDPAGQGFLIHRNSRVGKQGGKVTQILRDSISVTEVFTATDGKSSPNTMTLALKPDKTTGGGAKDLNSGMSYP